MPEFRRELAEVSPSHGKVDEFRTLPTRRDCDCKSGRKQDVDDNGGTGQALSRAMCSTHQKSARSETGPGRIESRLTISQRVVDCELRSRKKNNWPRAGAQGAVRVLRWMVNNCIEPVMRPADLCHRMVHIVWRRILFAASSAAIDKANRRSRPAHD